MAAPLLGPLLGGVAAGGTSGLFGLFGGGDEESSGPELWEKGLNIGAAFYNAWMSSRTQKEAERKMDQLIHDMTRIAQESGGQALGIYDAGTEEIEGELKALKQRVMQTAGKFPQSLETQRRQFLGDVTRRGRESAEGFGAGMGGLLSRLRGEGNDLDAEYLDYENRALRELEGSSEQAEADINRAFDENAAIVGQDLLNRGLASSTEAAREYGGNTERRSAELRRFNESLARERIGVLAQFGGPRLAARERGTERAAGYEYGGIGQAFAANQNVNRDLAAYDAAMRGDIQQAKQLLLGYDVSTTGQVADWQSRDALTRAGFHTDDVNRLLGVLGSIDYVPAPPNNLNFGFGQNTAPVPQSASPWSSFAANAMPGVGNYFGSAALEAFRRPPVQPVQTDPYAGTGYYPDWITMASSPYGN